MPRRNVLVIEDDPAVARATERMLARNGIGVRLAESGEQGEDLLAAESGLFDTVLVDYSLPGANGLEVVKRLATCHTSLRFVLMSGLDPDSLPEEVTSAQFSGFLQKPFMMKELFAAIDFTAPNRTSAHC
jgi:DNA-binding response OmpR family regulator